MTSIEQRYAGIGRGLGAMPPRGVRRFLRKNFPREGCRGVRQFLKNFFFNISNNILMESNRASNADLCCMKFISSDWILLAIL